MFKLNTLRRRLALWVSPPRRADEVDGMDLRQWADMPSYHPIAERVPAPMPR